MKFPLLCKLVLLQSIVVCVHTFKIGYIHTRHRARHHSDPLNGSTRSDNHERYNGFENEGSRRRTHAYGGVAGSTMMASRQGMVRPMQYVASKVKSLSKLIKSSISRPSETAISLPQAVYKLGCGMISVAFWVWACKGGARPAVASAGAAASASTSGKSSMSPIQGACLWVSLFAITALLQSAESAMTKLSTWKIKEFEEEEGPNSPFASLSSNMTRLLSTILITTTACGIYSTALFVATAASFFPTVSLGIITAVLTAVTLFFGELLPKAIGVNNSEIVARRLVPLVATLSQVMRPATVMMNFLSDFFLKFLGLRSKEDMSVTEDMLRMVVTEAEKSPFGIDSAEGKMIKGVLDMQDTEVGRIMKPRVDMVALPVDTPAQELLRIATATRYSRIPVYKGDIDHIVGIVYSKDLLALSSVEDSGRRAVIDRGSDDASINALDWAQEVVRNSSGSRGVYEVTDTDSAPTGVYNVPISARKQRMNKVIVGDWKDLTAEDFVEETFFIPETMKAWTALQEMRRRRLHLAIVVDEYGGTSGLITFEDILEEVIGEIYDEDDDEEQQMDFQNIFYDQYVDSDGESRQIYTMRGYAELDDVCEALGLELTDDLQGEYSTIGGFFCSQADKMPETDDVVIFGGYVFTVTEVEDGRRIMTLMAEKINPTNASQIVENYKIVKSAGNSFGSKGNASADDADGNMHNGFDSSQNDMWQQQGLFGNSGNSREYAAGGQGPGGDYDLPDGLENEDGVVLTFIDGEWVRIPQSEAETIAQAARDREEERKLRELIKQERRTSNGDDYYDGS